MNERRRKFDPFARAYYADLTMLLQPRKGVTLNGDLFERLRVAGEKLQGVDYSPETTLKRASWCCYITGNIVLDVVDRELTRNHAAPEDRPLLSLSKLNAFEFALREILRTSSVDHAEHVMGESEGQRNAAQRHADRLSLMKTLSRRSLELIARAKAYFQSNAPDVFAELLGHDFFCFLVDARKSHDELVEFAEKMLEVHA